MTGLKTRVELNIHLGDATVLSIPAELHSANCLTQPIQKLVPWDGLFLYLHTAYEFHKRYARKNDLLNNHETGIVNRTCEPLVTSFTPLKRCKPCRKW